MRASAGGDGIVRTINYAYPVVQRIAKRSFKCRVCGKPGRRSTTFYQTLNPFNKNADGTVKTRAEIESELLAKDEAWSPDLVHLRCEENHS